MSYKSLIQSVYQDGDPTSREGNTVVDTDGGFIKIVGMDKPIGFQAIGDNLVVIASNGVWVVKGGSDYGFTATNYKVDRLSFNGSHAPRSIVKAGDKLAFFGDSGLFVVEQNQFKDLGVTDITQGTIHKFYASLPTASKNKASGAYDSISGKLRWVIPTYTLTQACVELVLDSSIGAFTLNNIKSLAITSVVCVPAPTLLASDDARYVTSQTTVYLCIWYYEIAGQYRYSFARYANVDFRDRDAFGGQHDAEAILITGEVTGGDSSVKKQKPHSWTNSCTHLASLAILSKSIFSYKKKMLFFFRFFKFLIFFIPLFPNSVFFKFSDFFCSFINFLFFMAFSASL